MDQKYAIDLGGFLAGQVSRHAKVNMNDQKEKALQQNVNDFLATINAINSVNYRDDVLIAGNSTPRNLCEYKFGNGFSRFLGYRAVTLVDKEDALPFQEGWHYVVSQDAKVLSPFDFRDAQMEIISLFRKEYQGESITAHDNAVITVGNVKALSDGESVNVDDIGGPIVPVFLDKKYFRPRYYAYNLEDYIKERVHDLIVTLREK
jgi:hypothetical protein